MAEEVVATKSSELRLLINTKFSQYDFTDHVSLGFLCCPAWLAMLPLSLVSLTMMMRLYKPQVEKGGKAIALEVHRGDPSHTLSLH